MHPYIPHLLDDIAAAYRTDIPLEDALDDSIDNHFEEIEKWLAGDERMHTFGYHCGLNVENFPPATQLTDAEMKIILDAFEKMMQSWNISIGLPDNMPVSFAYDLTIDILNQKTEIINHGFLTFDFCTGYAPDCKLKEYCPCLNIWNEGHNELDNNDNEK